jgi:hypothetical protein
MATQAPAVGNRCPIVIPQMTEASVQAIAEPCPFRKLHPRGHEMSLPKTPSALD